MEKGKIRVIDLPPKVIEEMIGTEKWEYTSPEKEFITLKG